MFPAVAAAAPAAAAAGPPPAAPAAAGAAQVRDWLHARATAACAFLLVSCTRHQLARRRCPNLPQLPKQGSFPLHWPLVNSEHMRDRLGQRELERKRIDDAKRLALQDPNHRWVAPSGAPWGAGGQGLISAGMAHVRGGGWTGHVGLRLWQHRALQGVPAARRLRDGVHTFKGGCPFWSKGGGALMPTCAALLPTPPPSVPRSEAELRDIRAFKEAAAALAALPDAQLRYDLRLAKFYMWAQTAATVFLACRVPTGGLGGWLGWGRMPRAGRGGLHLERVALRCW